LIYGGKDLKPQSILFSFNTGKQERNTIVGNCSDAEDYL